MTEVDTKLSLSQRIVQPLITGVISFLPLALTLAILAWVVVFLHDLVGPQSAFGRLLGSIGLNFVACEIIAYTLGLLGTFALVYAMGILFESGRGYRYQAAIEAALHRVPLVNTIYDASKHLTSMFDRKNEDVQAMTPVLCSFGGEGGTAALGLMPSPQRIRINGYDYHVVIIPTAPVPFGGALLCVPADNVKPAGCNLDAMVNVFMSMGASAPQYLGKEQDSDTETAAGPP
jgi:uncharacterized membrane protein